MVLFEPTSENYANALPNKFFEYLMAGLPVLTSNIGTFTEYVAQYKVGRTVDPANVEQIAVILSDMISDQNLLEKWHKNALLAAQKLNWDNESQKMHAIYDDLGKK